MLRDVSFRPGALTWCRCFLEDRWATIIQQEGPRMAPFPGGGASGVQPLPNPLQRLYRRSFPPGDSLPSDGLRGRHPPNHRR
ncbi:hypothetical protein J437_LFUL014474 [Ladona fulva]|uniref:Uncharacterized protein n=1 Tax=Ladona fulva TaxID=123851 RepID=A0A8K0NW82_LADFU|nr:hypothetical protein J437_LFUL014474 [Ladona fulva]